MLADSAALQVGNVSNDEDSYLKRHSQQHCHNPQAMQDRITHTLEPASSPMVRLQHLLFTLMPSEIKGAVLSVRQTPYSFLLVT